MLISNKVDFRANKITWYKGEYFIMIRANFPKEVKWQSLHVHSSHKKVYEANTDRTETRIRWIHNHSLWLPI